MKGLNKLALASAVLAISTGSFAMEAMQDDALSSTTGQAGLTILSSNVSVTASAVRYYDSDGISPASAFYTTIDSTHTVPAGPCAGSTASACVATFSVGGSLNLAGFSLTATSIETTIDVGSTSTTGTTAVSGLLVGTTITGLNLNVGAISIDNGTELDGTLGLGRAATNTPTYTGGYLTSGSDLGGLAITGLTIPQSAILITGGASILGTNSGLTITNLLPISDLSLTVNYYDTSKEAYASGTFTPNAASTKGSGVGGAAVAGDGLISLPVDLLGVLQGPTEIAAGNNTTTGYNPTGAALGSSGSGLAIAMTGTVISALDIGGHDTGKVGGISLAGTNAGSIGILGLTIGGIGGTPTFINITGH